MNIKELFGKMGRSHYLLLVIVAIPYFLMFLPRHLFYELTREDGIFEDVSAVYYLLAILGCFLLCANAENFRNPADRATYFRFTRRYAFLLLGLFFFVSLGEEISWGQRILDYETPEVIEEHNVQGEFNVHNLEVFNPVDMNKAPKQGLAAVFTAKRIFIAIFTFYLFAIPLLSVLNDRVRKLLQRFYIPVPPIWLGIIFVANIFIFEICKAYLGDRKLRYGGISEVEEFNIALLLMLLPFVFLRFPQFFRKQGQRRILG